MGKADLVKGDSIPSAANKKEKLQLGMCIFQPHRVILSDKGPLAYRYIIM